MASSDVKFDNALGDSDSVQPKRFLLCVLKIIGGSRDAEKICD